jgi:predicted dehydrogenase
MNKKKVLIVGLGKIGLHYDIKNSDNFKLSHANSFFSHNFFDLQGGVDKKKNNLKLFKKKYNLPCFLNIKKALTFVRPNVVVVATPSRDHFAVIKKIFTYSRPELILCEKPLSDNFGDALNIYNLCKVNNSKLLVNYSRRYDNYLFKIKNILKKISSNKIFCNVYYSKGILTNGSHFLNLSEYLFGKLIKVKIFKKKRLQKDFAINFYAEFKGAGINFINTENIFSSNFFEVFSDKFLIRVTYNRVYYYKIKKNKLMEKFNLLDDKKNILFKINPRLVNFNVINEISKLLKGQKAFVCEGKEALTTMKNLKFIINHE